MKPNLAILMEARIAETLRDQEITHVLILAEEERLIERIRHVRDIITDGPIDLRPTSCSYWSSSIVDVTWMKGLPDLLSKEEVLEMRDAGLVILRRPFDLEQIASTLPYEARVEANMIVFYDDSFNVEAVDKWSEDQLSGAVNVFYDRFDVPMSGPEIRVLQDLYAMTLPPKQRAAPTSNTNEWLAVHGSLTRRGFIQAAEGRNPQAITDKGIAALLKALELRKIP